MSNVFVQQPAIQKLLRDSAGLDVAGGDERFKAIIHRLLENICTLIDDYNVTEEEFWHAVNYLHELGGRQEAALLAAALAWLFAESVLQARPIPALTKALRTALPLAVLAGVCYNFCVYFAAEPQLMGQNPALYENVSRLVQFWL